MLNIRAIACAGLSAWLGAVGGLAGQGRPPCYELEGATVQADLRYLQGDRSNVKAECVAYAADRIGLHRYAEASKTLVRYLDYRMPTDPREASLPPISPISGPRYPAINALFEIGKPAVDDLVEAVGNSATSDGVRKNAIQVLYEIFREDVAGAVRVLNRASNATRDPEVRQRLFDAARKTAGMCHETMRNACMNALR